MTASWQTARVGPTFDVLAPDGSEIRVLVQVGGGSLVHCTLRPGQVTQAVRHRTVEEVWFCVGGRGELWRRSAEAQDRHPDGPAAEAPDGQTIAALERGVAVTIPLGTEFQFRTVGDEPLEVIITTMPPWPGPDEAVPVAGHWQPSVT